MIGYFKDVDAEGNEDYVTMTMNGWDAADPAWWLNLQANEAASLALPGRTIAVNGRAANEGEEHDRLWARWRELDHSVDNYSAQRTNGTPAVILSPA